MLGKSLAAPFSANKPHKDLLYSPIHGIESDNTSEIVTFPSGIASNLPVSVSSISSIPLSVSSVIIPSEGTSNNTQSTASNISNEGSMQSIDLTESEDVNVKEIILHCQNLRVDLVEAFKTVNLSDTIRFIIINARGEKEPGVGAGVERDIYSSAWKEILDGLCVGERERVPFVRHDLYINEWNSIAKILVKGFMDTKYFPLQLRKAFIIHVLFREVNNDCFIKSFLNYVTPMESKIVETALRGTHPQIYDDDHFLDTLDRFNSKSRVTITNVYGVILEISKQELVKQPYIMLCSCKKCLCALETFLEFSTVSNDDYYQHILPKNRNVIKLIQSGQQMGMKGIHKDSLSSTFKV